MGIHELRLAMRDPGSIFWILVAPFLWVFFFGFINRPDDPTQVRIGLGVVNEDGSAVAARLVSHLRWEKFELVVAESAGDLPAGERAPSRTLTIPKGFHEALERHEKIDVILHEGENANPDATFAVQLALHRAIVRLLADESFGPSRPEDDLVRVTSSYAGRRAIPSGNAQTVPGNLVMFVLLVALSSGSAHIAHERKSRILSRLAASPLSRTELILGKLAGRVVTSVVQVTLFVLLGLTLFHMDWGSSPLGLALVLTSLVACAAALSLLGGALFASPDAAAGVGVTLSLVMSALGGCWWPAEVMPPWIRTAGHVFPTAWAMDGLHQIVSWGGGLRDVLIPSAALLAMALAAGAVAVRRLRFD